MGIPAIPAYLNKHLAGDPAPPGHRFGPYFPVWKMDWTIEDRKKEALQQVLSVGQPAAEILRHICSRQKVTADALGQDTVRSFDAVSTSPFLTGVGMEHPVENGFAFLSPYGLPYLAGSGVKGVLRQAAEELALMPDENDRKGWNMLALWRLFGFDAAAACLGVTTGLPQGVPELAKMAETRAAAYRAAVARLNSDDAGRFMEAVTTAEQRKPFRDNPRAFLSALIDNRKLRESINFRGALSFWDVFPEPFGNSLGLDILNPHHGKYYQDRATPADCESPVPNFFLVLPSKSRFDFYVQCEKGRLPEDLASRWKTLLHAAFIHAFDWLGFGAKTSVGYGAMQIDNSAEEIRRRKEKEKKERLAHQAREQLAREQELAEQARQEAARQEQARKEEALRREREQQAEVEKMRLAAEAARRQAEFDALPESEKSIRRLNEQLAPFKGKVPLDKKLYPEFSGIMNSFAETARSWPSAEDREQAAKCMGNILDRLGWTPTGLNKSKREKQEQKRRDMIEAVRRGSD